MNGILLRQARRNAAPTCSTVNTIDNLRICLEHGKAISLDGDNRGKVISCRQGVIWITQPGDPTDYRLTAKESFTVSRRGRIVVQALEDGVIEIGQSLS